MTPNEKLIERYQEAYEAIHGRREYNIRYERGWFSFELVNGFPTWRKRRAEVESMCSRLEWRHRSAART